MPYNILKVLRKQKSHLDVPFLFSYDNKTANKKEHYKINLHFFDS